MLFSAPSCPYESHIWEKSQCVLFSLSSLGILTWLCHDDCNLFFVVVFKNTLCDLMLDCRRAFLCTQLNIPFSHTCIRKQWTYLCLHTAQQITIGNGILRHCQHQYASHEAIKRCCSTQITAVELQQPKAHSP